MGRNFEQLAHLYGQALVALHVRAWVEIDAGGGFGPPELVALHVRAWVEIQRRSWHSVPPDVALYARAWVEIQLVQLVFKLLQSPSTRGRG